MELRGLHFFRDGMQILAPIVPEYDDFDARVCVYLEDYANNKLRDQALDGDHGKARDFFAWIGFILAALAAGSQCSAVACPLRQAKTQEFGMKAHSVCYRPADQATVFRAFHCLRMSNFLLRPTLHVVQTYLLILIVLQNDSEPDAAWALIGTIMRLAQSIGLHLPHSYEQDSSEVKALKASTW